MTTTHLPDGRGVLRHVRAWKPEQPDARDLMLYSSPDISRRLPSVLDWRPDTPPPRDQLQAGTCGGHALRTAQLYERYSLEPQLALDPSFDYSPGFAYWAGKLADGSDPALDEGITVRGAFKGALQYGICTEAEFPYDGGAVATKTPPLEVVTSAHMHRVMVYVRCMNLDAIKLQLNRGYLVVIGIDLPPSAMEPAVANTGLLPWDSRPGVGGHMVIAVGYDDEALGGSLIIENSWGKLWGQRGYFYLDYRYVHEHRATDARSLQRVECGS